MTSFSYPALSAEAKKLLTLSWPLLIAQLMQTAIGVTDTIMAGQYSALDLAAVAVGYSFTVPVLFFLQGICLSVGPLLATLRTQNPTDIGHTLWQTIYALAGFCVIIWCGYFFAQSALLGINTDQELMHIASEYILVVLLSAPFFSLYQLYRNYNEALQDTASSMKIMIAGFGLNIPLNYMFINGLGPLPELGGVGCGVATAFTFLFMMLLSIGKARANANQQGNSLFSNISTPCPRRIKAVLKRGIPVSLTLIFEVSLFAVVAVLLAPFGKVEIAGHQIALSIASLLFMLPLSLSMGVAIQISNYLGSLDAEKARLTFFAGQSIGLMTAIGTMALIFGFDAYLVQFYTDDLAVAHTSIQLLMMAAIFQIPDIIQVINAHSLRAYGDTTAMFILSFLSYWGFGLSSGVILGLTDWVVPAMGALGFWIGFVVGLSCSALLLTLRIQSRTRCFYSTSNTSLAGKV